MRHTYIILISHCQVSSLILHLRNANISNTVLLPSLPRARLYGVVSIVRFLLRFHDVSSLLLVNSKQHWRSTLLSNIFYDACFLLLACSSPGIVHHHFLLLSFAIISIEVPNSHGRTPEVGASILESHNYVRCLTT